MCDYRWVPLPQGQASMANELQQHMGGLARAVFFEGYSVAEVQQSIADVTQADSKVFEQLVNISKQDFGLGDITKARALVILRQVDAGELVLDSSMY